KPRSAAPRGRSLLRRRLGPSRTKARWLWVESPSRFSLLFAHDLRANASRLSRGKTATHFSGSCAMARRTGSDQTAHHGNQAAALLLCSDRDAQEIFDPGFLEMSNQNAALPKLGSETCATAAAVAHEDEVRHGW